MYAEMTDKELVCEQELVNTKLENVQLKGQLLHAEFAALNAHITEVHAEMTKRNEAKAAEANAAAAAVDTFPGEETKA